VTTIIATGVVHVVRKKSFFSSFRIPESF